MTIPSTTSPPRLFQFRLATLLILTTWAAIVCAGLAAPSPPWPTIISAASLLSILTAAVSTVYRVGRTRAFAIGYLIFSIGCLLFLELHFRMPWPQLWIDPNFPADSAPMILFHVLHGNEFGTASSAFASLPSPPTKLRPFLEIYYFSLATLLGLLGALLAQYLHATQHPNPPTPNNP
jgi:hypothetical protein